MGFNEQSSIYNHGYDTDNELMGQNINNRLFATFSVAEEVDSLIQHLTSLYSILYKKIFILELKDSNELILTYNVENGNVNTIPENTILVHRKKVHNVLYSLNSLNCLIKNENGGQYDSSYQVNWENYKNSILLTQGGEFKQLHTKIYKIIEL